MNEKRPKRGSKRTRDGLPGIVDPSVGRDFDFGTGMWSCRVRAGKNRATEYGWSELEGTTCTRSLWEGSASLEEAELRRGGTSFDWLSLRLYRPDGRAWGLYSSDGASGKLQSPYVGSFSRGRGEFFSHGVASDRFAFLRQTITVRGSDAYDVARFRSYDGGRSWQTSWTAELERQNGESARPTPHTSIGSINRDFDFQIGSWRMRVSRRLQMFGPSDAWVEYEGTSEVCKIWSGRANLLEMDVTGPAGRIQGMGLRLFDPKTRQWNLNWVNRRDGIVQTPPAIGEFHKGVGEFYSQEFFESRTIFCRNTISRITDNESRFEQAFSSDGGMTWQPNWKMSWTRK
jgi:hypothetical protein